MPLYISNDHLILGNLSGPGALWRKRKPDFQKKLDFKAEQRHKQTDKQTEDRPAQPAPLLVQEIRIPWTGWPAPPPQ